MSVSISSRLRLSQYGKKAERQAKLGLNDVLDDLVRTASQNAPHDEGVLEKSWSKQISDNKGTVSFTVKHGGGKGNFNYALKMHETSYNLGEKSRAKSGGVGMSGKHYDVGKGYLKNVLIGEEKAYKKHIEQMIKNV